MTGPKISSLTILHAVRAIREDGGTDPVSAFQGRGDTLWYPWSADEQSGFVSGYAVLDVFADFGVVDFTHQGAVIGV